MMVLGSKAFGKWLGHESGVLMDGSTTVMKETPESSLVSSAKRRQRKKLVVDESESGL